MLIPKPITDRAQRKRQRCQDGHGEPETAPERVVTVLPSQPCQNGLGRRGEDGDGAGIRLSFSKPLGSAGM